MGDPMDHPCSSTILGEAVQLTNIAHLWQRGHEVRKNPVVLLDSDVTLTGWTTTGKVFRTSQAGMTRVRTTNFGVPANLPCSHGVPL